MPTETLTTKGRRAAPVPSREPTAHTGEKAAAAISVLPVLAARAAAVVMIVVAAFQVQHCASAPVLDDSAPAPAIGMLYPAVRMELNGTPGADALHRPFLNHLDDAMESLEGWPGSGPAIGDLLSWAATAQAQPAGPVLHWTLPMALQDVRETLRHLGNIDSPSDPNIPESLVLWLPPDDSEVAPRDDTDEARHAASLLRRLAQEQLFGPNRQLALQVIRGRELPLAEPFERTIPRISAP